MKKIMVGTALAMAVNSAVAVKVQETNIGQVLLGNLYYANVGLNTDITVVNNRTDYAVKAKIVFREKATSSELLDFILYLSPGDVWRGRVVADADGEARIVGWDDSQTDNDGEWVSELNPLDFPFYDKNDTGFNNFGHIEVVGAYALSEGSTTVISKKFGGNIAIKRGMDKADLRDVFDVIEANGSPVYAHQVIANETKINGDGLYSKISIGDADTVQLSGNVAFNTPNENFFNYQLTALGPTSTREELDTLGLTDVTCSYPENCIINNPNFDVTTGEETILGKNFGRVVSPGAGGGPVVYSPENIVGIEHALATKFASWSYEVNSGYHSEYSTNDTVLPIITFPTKYRHANNAILGDCALSENPTHFSAPFADSAIGEVQYSLISWNNVEQYAVAREDEFSGTTERELEVLNDEVNLIAPDYFANSGWARINFTDTLNDYTSCGYTGMPALITVAKMQGTKWHVEEANITR